MVCLGAIAGGISALVLANTAPVVIATSVPHPPYDMLDDRDRVVGLDRDIGDEICRRAALRCDWVVARFDLLLPGVASGDYDIAMAGIAVTPARMGIVDFTVPYDIGSDIADFIGKPDAPTPDQARIAVQSGTIHEAHLRATGRAFRSFGTPEEVAAALLSGAVDLAFGTFDETELTRLSQAAGIAVRSSEQVVHSGTAMAVCKGNDALRQQLDAAITAMLADGTIDKIAGRWTM
jgi:polar amino acid transport system substrate-binding protein